MAAEALKWGHLPLLQGISIIINNVFISIVWQRGAWLVNWSKVLNTKHHFLAKCFWIVVHGSKAAEKYKHSKLNKGLHASAHGFLL